MNRFLHKYDNKLPALLGVLLFIYLLFRVILMPITIDEYTSINVHASMSWWDIIKTGQPNIVWAPNNHILNTLFIKLEWAIFGKKDWALRLHILGAFVVCFIYTVKIFQRITTSKIRQVLYLIIFFVNPYLLDFFGIARGYALSIAAFNAAFYYFMLYTEELKIKNLRYAFVSLFLAVWANFSALYVLTLIVVLFCYLIYSNRKTIRIKQAFLAMAIACCGIAGIIIVPLLKTLRSEESYGGKTGLFQDTVVNYIYQFIHFNPYINRHAVFAPGWKYIEVAGIGFLLLWLLFQFTGILIKSSKYLTRLQYYCLFLVFGIAGIAEFLFIFFHVPLPSGRTELLYAVPFYIGICVVFEIIILKWKFAVIPVYLMAIFSCWHTYSSVNFDKTIEWWQTGDAKRVVRYLKEDLGGKSNPKKQTIGIETWQYPSLAFYTETVFKDELNTQWTDLGVDNHYDYLFVSEEKTNMVWPDYELLKKFRYGSLFKLKSNEIRSQ
ncbi:MAG: hypothetical protein ABIQ02_08895 [Saprospiraceae bacterium]